MNYELIFSLINLSVMPAWFLLIVLPRWSVTRAIVHSGIYPIALGLFYLVCFVYALTQGGGEMDFMSLEGVMTTFQDPLSLLMGWSHYLVFDLFVGAWIGRDALRRGVTHWLAAPSMLLSFLLGPIGLLLYLLGRALLGRGFSLIEADTPKP